MFLNYFVLDKARLRGSSIWNAQMIHFVKFCFKIVFAVAEVWLFVDIEWLVWFL